MPSSLAVPADDVDADSQEDDSPTGSGSRTPSVFSYPLSADDGASSIRSGEGGVGGSHSSSTSHRRSGAPPSHVRSSSGKPPLVSRR
jgi:hypothetical protein